MVSGEGKVEPPSRDALPFHILPNPIRRHVLLLLLLLLLSRQARRGESVLLPSSGLDTHLHLVPAAGGQFCAEIPEAILIFWSRRADEGSQFGRTLHQHTFPLPAQLLACTSLDHQPMSIFVCPLHWSPQDSYVRHLWCIFECSDQMLLRTFWSFFVFDESFLCPYGLTSPLYPPELTQFVSNGGRKMGLWRLVLKVLFLFSPKWL